MINNPVHKQLPTLENPGTAIDLRSGKSLIAPDGSVVTGTLPEVEQATPAISVSSGGLITASAVQAGGIVADGTKSATQQLDTQGGTTITPGTAAKTAVAAGRYTTGTVTVAGDSNLASANIAKGVSIFGVAGSYSGTEPVYEIASTGNVQFESSPAFAGNYEHHAKITVSRNVGQLLGLSLWLILGDNSTLFFSYPGTAYEEPDTTYIYLLQGGTSLGLWHFNISGKTIDLYRECRQIWTSTSPPSLGMPAAVYYLPT